MAAPTTQGQIHPVFQKFLQSLQEHGKTGYDAAVGNAQRRWYTPPNFTNSLLNIPELHNPSFDRDAINLNYEKVMQNANTPGTGGDVTALKQQIDYVAAGERAWRLRHASVPRLLAHAAARQYGQGYGPLFDRIRSQAEELIRVGGAARAT